MFAEPETEPLGSNPEKPLTDKEIDARREAGLKKLLTTPHKPHKKKDAGLAPDASQSIQNDRKKLSGSADHGRKAKKAHPKAL